jgi:hypothetical protein
MSDTGTQTCYYCGGPLLGDGAETDGGHKAHAICESNDQADPDMNPL